MSLSKISNFVGIKQNENLEKHIIVNIKFSMEPYTLLPFYHFYVSARRPMFTSHRLRGGVFTIF
ncbi:hypothetical protein BFP77_09090 [Maribacter sp. 4U21]|nr:hypothetical protein BFP77_09090 [Maribacter sp. 4U21]